MGITIARLKDVKFEVETPDSIFSPAGEDRKP